MGGQWEQRSAPLGLLKLFIQVSQHYYEPVMFASLVSAVRCMCLSEAVCLNECVLLCQSVFMLVSLPVYGLQFDEFVKELYQCVFLCVCVCLSEPMAIKHFTAVCSYLMMICHIKTGSCQFPPLQLLDGSAPSVPFSRLSVAISLQIQIQCIPIMSC